MVIAHHLIMTAYGWWLPNDPRGSSSHDIRVEPVEELGELHYGRRARQPLSRELREFYQKAEQVLRHPLLTFEDADLAEIAAAFAETIRNRRYTCYAAALMPDHVHLLVRVHRDRAEEMLSAFQESARTGLRESARRFPTHPVWGGPGWKVFISDRRRLETVIHYIEQNPINARRPPQTWDFVTPYDGWLPGLHPDRSHPSQHPQ
jgi:REP element-mobilizing transposase RayT